MISVHRPPWTGRPLVLAEDALDGDVSVTILFAFRDETAERSPVAKAPPGWPTRFVPPRRHRVHTTALRIPRDSLGQPNMLRESMIHTGRSGGSGCNSEIYSTGTGVSGLVSILAFDRASAG
ncbi:hypothetical protein C5613_29715 [Rhodococcus opacus]|uniref:Uncharacterized protein n=1 Tax=Rhodococcus opacus TaxID=37919 RepID=A0A2S8IYB1_RHOOP|nr:hypothetical protein C5613_29715 [Rhodococcus opacus]